MCVVQSSGFGQVIAGTSVGAGPTLKICEKKGTEHWNKIWKSCPWPQFVLDYMQESVLWLPWLAFLIRDVIVVMSVSGSAAV